MVTSIISGGQTGADQGGLFAGKAMGIITGGYAPHGYKTELGFARWLGEDYGLMEHESPDYLKRTWDNVRLSEGTVIFGQRSPGSNKTEEYCRLQHKPCLWMPSYTIDVKNKLLFRSWVRAHKVETLNIAGNRESVRPGIQEGVAKFLVAALTEVR